MLKKTITYEDYNGDKVSGEFYFNLSKAELIEYEVSVDGGIKEHLEEIARTENPKDIIATMKDLVLRSYGERSADGKRFIKSPGMSDEFASTEAYSVLFMELVTNADAAVEFINGIVPADLVNPNQDELPLKDKMATALGTKPPDPRHLTEAEVREMDAEEFRSGLATGKYVYP